MFDCFPFLKHALSVANSVKIPEWQTVVQNLLNINMQTAYPNQHYSIWWWDKTYPKRPPCSVLDYAFRIDRAQGNSRLLTTDPINGSISFSDSPANYGMSSDRAGAIYTCIQIATDGSSFPYTASVVKDPVICFDTLTDLSIGAFTVAYNNDYADYYTVDTLNLGQPAPVGDWPIVPMSPLNWIHYGVLATWAMAPAEVIVPIISCSKCGQTFPLRAVGDAADYNYDQKALLELLNNQSIRDFFGQGHGSPTKFMCPAFDNEYPVSHRYRFVFLWGCDTYSLPLLRKFGAQPEEVPDQATYPIPYTSKLYYLAKGLNCAAFMGFTTTAPYCYPDNVAIEGKSYRWLNFPEGGAWNQTFALLWFTGDYTLAQAKSFADPEYWSLFNQTYPPHIPLGQEMFYVPDPRFNYQSTTTFDPYEHIRIGGYADMKFGDF